LSKYQWNPLTDEKEFENLINDLCSKKYGLEFQLYGRKGQKQNGIDGLALIGNNKFILYQCKNKNILRDNKTIKNELSKDLKEETSKVIEEFIDKKSFIIEKFIFAHSWKRDKDLQNIANSLNINILIWSWDEISDMLEEYEEVAQKYYPNFFKDIDSKSSITSLSNEVNFLNQIVLHIEREEHLMLLSMTPTPYHNKIAKHYKEKVYNIAKNYFSEESIFSIHPPINKDITQEKYFSKLAKQCNFDNDVEDGDEFVELLSEKMETDNIFLLISEFENGSDKHRKELAFALRPLLESYNEYSCTIVIFGRKKLKKLSLEENEYGISPLNFFEELLIPTPTIEDYKQIEKIEYDIRDIYQLTGGHPELMKFCIRNKSKNYKELILNSDYGDKLFRKYENRRSRILELFKQELFGRFSLWSPDKLIRDLFWDNLIVEEKNRFRWIAPIIVELGERYFR